MKIGRLSHSEIPVFLCRNGTMIKHQMALSTEWLTLHCDHTLRCPYSRRGKENRIKICGMTDIFQCESDMYILF